MARFAVPLWLVFALTLQGCAPPTLSELPASERRALGEAAVAKVCGYELDVETPIGFEHRYNLDIARQYLAQIDPNELAEGQLSQFVTIETIETCAADLEWGGVNFDVQRLVRGLGTEAEARAMLNHSSSLERECRFDGEAESASFVSACYALGFTE